MQIKIEENKVIVKQSTDSDEGFRDATPLEEGIISQGVVAQIEGAIYDPSENIEYQTQLAAQNKAAKKAQILETYQLKLKELQLSYVAKIGMGTANETTFRTQYAAVKNALLTELANA